MAILYTIRTNSPLDVPLFPPPVLDCAKFKEIATYLFEHAIPIGLGHGLIFESEAALTEFLNKYRFTDPDILADIKLWRESHNITYIEKCYELPTIKIDNLRLFGPV